MYGYLMPNGINQKIHTAILEFIVCGQLGNTNNQKWMSCKSGWINRVNHRKGYVYCIRTSKELGNV